MVVDFLIIFEECLKFLVFPENVGVLQKSSYGLLDVFIFLELVWIWELRFLVVGYDAILCNIMHRGYNIVAQCVQPSSY